ncbi:hypothetical protein ACP70R_028647 [Stipagrostis hirtigluma subsp. patula]
MARFLFFLRYSRRRRICATLRLLRSAKRHLALASAPASPQRRNAAVHKVLRSLRVPLDAGGRDEHGVLTLEQVKSFDDEAYSFVNNERHYLEEAAFLSRKITEEMVPAVKAIARSPLY